MNRLLIALWLFLSSSVMVGAQGYGTYNNEKYHSSSVYYVTLQGAMGENLVSRFASADGIIGAFVDGELRGTSEMLTIHNPLATHEVQLFVIRVWGDGDDPATVSFRIKEYMLEYELDTADFGRDAEMTYGSPSSPLLFTYVPVTGLELSPFNVSVLLGGTQTVSARLSPVNHSRISPSTPINITFTNYGDEQLFSITQQPSTDMQQPTMCVVKGLSRGTGVLYVTATYNGEVMFMASAMVSVLTDGVPVTGIRNDMPSLDLEKEVGDEFRLLFTVLPENATNRKVTYEIGNAKVLYDTEDEFGTTFHCAQRGESTIKVTTVDGGYTLLYNVRVGGEVENITLTYPDVLTLSKLRDVVATFTTEPVGARVVPELVNISVSSSPNEGWGVAATTKADDATGRRWAFRGRYAGTYSYSVKYNGEPMKTVGGKETGTLYIPAEFPFDSGWDWISLYAAPASGSIVLKTGDDSYLSTLQLNADNKVIEIRSQHDLLHNDPELGFYGTLEALTPTDGAYKIYSKHTEANTAMMAFNAGYDGLCSADNMELPLIHKGFTWITYPHELDHKVMTLDPYLSVGAHDGDQIIGRDGFIEYNGSYWESAASFRFRAGKGYVYYTESNGGNEVNWGPATLSPEEEEEEEPSLSPHSSQSPLWSQSSQSPQPPQSSKFSEVMPVVAALDATSQSDNYLILAFVDGDLRGIGEPVVSSLSSPLPLFHLTISGQRGETITLSLYNTVTQQLTPMPQTLTFSQKAGSHRQPVALGTHIQGIADSPQCAGQFPWPASQPVYDLQGRRMESSIFRSALPLGSSKNVPSSTLKKGLYIMNGRKVIREQ